MSLEETPESEVNINIHDDARNSMAMSFDFSKIPEDNDDACDELYVTVSDPQQHGDGVTAYASYLIKVKSTIPGIKNEPFEIRRRFADFQWLFEELNKKSEGYLVPPMPDYSVVQKFVGKFEQTLLEYRGRELQRFLRRMCAHNVLRNSTELQSFLSSDDASFQEYKTASTEITTASTSNAIGGWFASAKKAVGNAVPSVIGGAVEEKDEYFREKTAYFTALQTALLSAHTAIRALGEHQRNLKAQLTLPSDAALVLAQAESFDAAAAEQETRWRTAAVSWKDEERALSDMGHQYKVEFEDLVHGYKRYVEQVNSVIKFRWDKWVALTVASRQLETKRAATKQKQADIEAAEAYLSEATAVFERVTGTVREEIQRFEATKAREIAKCLNRLANLTIAYHLKSADAWRSLMEGSN